MIGISKLASTIANTLSTIRDHSRSEEHCAVCTNRLFHTKLSTLMCVKCVLLKYCLFWLRDLEFEISKKSVSISW